MLPATVEDLDGYNFVSTSIKGPGMKPGKIRLSFWRGTVYGENGETIDPRGPIMVFYAGCNYIGGGYGVRNGRLRWTSSIDTTLVGCEPNRDFWLATRLRGGIKAFMNGKTLLLQGKRGVRIKLKPRE